LKKIAVIGLGYVGFPLAYEFSKKYDLTGFDISKKRISELKNGIDKTEEYSKNQILDSKLFLSNDEKDLINQDIYIITVPTPLKKNNKPNLKPLISASKTVGKYLSKGSIVIYESTVYPGCTEEDCIPILEKYSNLKYNLDFLCGYSPERINPGDKKRKLTDIIKVVSGSNKEATKIIDNLYKSIVKAGTYVAESIKVAEASKIIENVQRDVNISLVNEFALIFEKLNIDTKEVLDAAATKWNFLNYKPGLVGGHCIGVDPYYLAYKALKKGYSPKVLLNGRKVNNSIPKRIVKSVFKKSKEFNLNIKSSKILILGVTFKENCSDIRNSRVIDLIKEFKKICDHVLVHDYYADPDELKKYYSIELKGNLNHKYDIAVLAVAHDNYLKIDFSKLLNINHILYDVKSVLPKNISTLRL
tara:strand:+ start:1088 stop:2335 length:1248 start_codon:yes stop_codon:yes gene_type:complete